MGILKGKKYGYRLTALLCSVVVVFGVMVIPVMAAENTGVRVKKCYSYSNRWGGKIYDACQSYSVVRYDKKGRLIQESEYNKAGKLVDREKYQYNAAGLLTKYRRSRGNGSIWKEEQRVYDSNNRLIEKSASYSSEQWGYRAPCVRDENGRLIEKSRYTWGNYDKENETYCWTQKYTYDERGNLLESVRYVSEDGAYAWKKVYTYNENNQCLTYTEYNSKGEIRDMEEFVYDAKGKEIEHTRKYGIDLRDFIYFKYTYDENGILKEKEYRNDLNSYKTIYDTAGNEIENFYYNKSGKLTGHIVRTYNKKNNLAETERYDKNGELTGRTVYTYNKKGALTEEKEYDKDGKKTQNIKTYKYDKDGNEIFSSEYWGGLVRDNEYVYNADGKLRMRKTLRDGKVEEIRKVAYYK